MILGIDPGERRIGVAIADPETRFARPLEVIDARASDPIARICDLVAEFAVDRVVVGRPVGLSGRAGPAVDRQQEFVTTLRASCGVDIVEVDERFTSVIADRNLRASGRTAKDARSVRDSVAAQILLQDYLDASG